MKKIALVLLCLTAILLLVGCGKEVPGPQGEQGIQDLPINNESPSTFEISEDGYLIVDGEKTEYKTYACSLSAHSYGAYTTYILPTCISLGLEKRVCAFCDSEDYNVIPATGNHSFYDMYVMESTCVSRKVLKACSLCNTSAVIDEKTTAEHNYVDKICTVCGELQPSDGLEFSLNSDEKSYSVDSIGNCTDTDIVVPSTYNGLPVTGFYLDDRHNCDNITSITLPNSVTSIECNSFSGCDSLSSIIVDINNQYYKDIDGNLYSKDGKILIRYAAGKEYASFTIPNGVTSIGESAFDFCYNLTSVTIPSSVTFIDGAAFYGCDSLTSVIFEENSRLTTIGNSAFAYCDNLTSVTIPSSVTSIGNGTFLSCVSLTNITVDANNQYYQDMDGNLYSKDGKVLIQYSAGKKDASFTIPNGVTSIGDYAFADCDNLTSVTIPSSVTSIGECAFRWCRSLTSVIFEENSRLTSLGDYAFSACKKLTSITIPSSVTNIKGNSFEGCDSLSSIIVDINNQYYKDIDGNLYSKDGKILIRYAAGKEYASFTIPNGVTSIGECAFSHCDRLTSITIPNSVTSIGRAAFYYCNRLTSITISNSVTSIGGAAFNSCDKLTTVYYTGTESEWNDISIGSSNSKLTSATRYYYYESEPTSSGNYWHYDENGAIVVW